MADEHPAGDGQDSMARSTKAVAAVERKSRRVVATGRPAKTPARKPAKATRKRSRKG